MKIKYNIRGVKEIQAYLKTKIPRGVTKVALKAIVTWLIGDSQSGLKHPEPYKYASRKKAYGKVASDGAPAGYFSWKQFRYVAAITNGFTMRGSKRTGKSTDAWTYREQAGGYQFKLINETPAAYWTRDDKGQARQPASVGWLKVSAVIEKNMKSAIRAANAAVKAYLKEK